MSYKDIILEKENGVVRLTLNRPDKLNATTPNMRSELLEGLNEVSRDDSVRVVIITGAGRGFCSGADIRVFMAPRLKKEANKTQPSTRRSLLTPVGGWALSLARFEKPIIAAINGVAVGAGLGITLSCDVRIASEKAQFGAAWVKRGLVPDLGTTYLLPKIVGVDRAVRLMYTGEIIDAAEAERIGLVSEVVPHDSLMEAANELGRRIATGPPIAQELIKRAVFRQISRDMIQQIDFETYAQGICHGSEDHKEGIAAFLEKREAKFKGV